MYLPWKIFIGCWSYCVLFLILTIGIYFKNNDEKTAIILGSISGALFTVGLSAYLYDIYHINKSQTIVRKFSSLTDTNSLTKANLPQTLDFEHYSDTYTYVDKVLRCDICLGIELDNKYIEQRNKQRPKDKPQDKKPITHQPTINDGYSHPYSETVKKYYHVDCAFAYFKDKYHL